MMNLLQRTLTAGFHKQNLQMPALTAFSVRPMTRNDLDQAFNLSVAEGWNQTETDWRFLLEKPDNVCIVAEKENRIAGTATALVHSGKVAWIGMVLVDKAMRGMGAGKMLMSEIIQRLGRIESVKLDATPAGQPLYKSLGFKDEYSIFRMTTASLKSADSRSACTVPLHITSERLQSVINLDTINFGVTRDYLLQHLSYEFPEKALSCSGSKNSWGYVLGRNGNRFAYVGPLCASSMDIVTDLISYALKPLVNQPVAIDVLSDKTEFIMLLESLGFVRQREFTRMYLKKNPHPGRPEYQYLISGPEFG